MHPEELTDARNGAGVIYSQDGGSMRRWPPDRVEG